MANCKLDPIDQLTSELEGAQTLLRQKAVDWITTLASGIAQHIDRMQYSDGELVMHLRTPLTGEIATRSRVPVTFVLETALRIGARVEKDGEVVLTIDGILIEPIAGARQVYQQLQPVWEEAKESRVACPEGAELRSPVYPPPRARHVSNEKWLSPAFAGGDGGGQSGGGMGVVAEGKVAARGDEALEAY